MASEIGSLRSAAIAMPRASTEMAIPASIAVSPTSMYPSSPPKAITATNVAGTVQIARPPICALSTPTLTIARKWSSPRTGCDRPPMNEPYGRLAPSCANETAGTSHAAMAPRRTPKSNLILLFMIALSLLSDSSS